MTRCANTEALDIFLYERDAEQRTEEAAEALAIQWLAESHDGDIANVADALCIKNEKARALLADNFALIFTETDDAVIARRFRQVVADAVWAEATRVVTA
jgi:hypothetical protein